PGPACCRSTWEYSGVGLTAGIRWSPTEDSGVAASVSYGGTLEAAPQDTIGARQEWNLPLTVQGAASGRIGQNTLVAIGGSWAGWAELDEALTDDGGARDTWSASAGVEWDGVTINQNPIPLRVGARTASLPFPWDAQSGEER